MVRHFTLLFLNRTKSSRNDNPRTRHVHDHYAAITECAVSITRIVSELHNLYCGVGPPSVPFLRFIFFTPINTWLSVNPSLLISPTHDGMLGNTGLRLRFCTSFKLISSLSVLLTWVALQRRRVGTRFNVSYPTRTYKYRRIL